MLNNLLQENTYATQDAFEIVHIENDIYLRQAWLLEAERLNIKILSLENPDLLPPHFPQISPETIFYIDSNFGHGKRRGEEWALDLYKLGFTKIYLATGQPAALFAEIPWVRSIVGKQFPQNIYPRKT